MRFGNMNQYNPQLNHSLILVRKKRRRRKIAALVVITSFTVLIVAFAISKKRNYSPEDSTKADVSFSSSELQFACSGTQESLDACAELCRPASCCFKQVGAQGSCLGKHVDTCQEYVKFCRPDQLKDDGLTAKEKISILNATCSINGISHSNGYYACARLCEERSCCFADISSTCYHYKPIWCDQYSICKNLQTYSDYNGTSSPATNSTNSTAEPAPSPMFQSRTSESIRDNISQDHNATAQNEDEENDILAVKKLCTISKIISDEGYVKCEEICSKRLCCFSESEDNCHSTREEWCSQFESCFNLHDVKHK